MLHFSQTEQEQYRVLQANVLSSTMHSCFVVRARTEILTAGFHRVCLHPTHRATRHILPAKRQPSCLEGAMLPQGSGSAGCNNITGPRERALCISIRVAEVDSTVSAPLALARLWTVAASSEPRPRAHTKSPTARVGGVICRSFVCVHEYGGPREPPPSLSPLRLTAICT